jgi:hypothetical protein
MVTRCCVVRRGVPAQPPELRGILWVAVLGLPRTADREAVEAAHAEHPDISDSRSGQLRVLGEARAHQQAAVGPRR